MKKLYGWLATIGIFLLNFAKIFKFLVVLVKFPFFKTFASMILTLLAYAGFFGWKFAVALIVSLFVHEMGHVWAAKKVKLSTSPAIFIPFIGAVIGLKEEPKDVQMNAFIGIMGPVFGALLTVACIPVYLITQDETILLMIYLGAFLNAFNLVPVSPLDGGRVLSAISIRVWIIGLAFMITYFVMQPSFIVALVILMGLAEIKTNVMKQTEAKMKLEQIQLLNKKLQYIETVPYVYLDDNAFSRELRGNNHYEKFGFFKWFVFNKWKKNNMDARVGEKAARIYETACNDVIQSIENIDEYSDRYQSNAIKERLYGEMYKQIVHKWQTEHDEVKKYYTTSRKVKTIIITSYVLLIVVLVAIYQWATNLLDAIIS